MSTKGPKAADLSALETFALRQGGYFRREDAHNYGITDRLLTYHKRTGRFERLLPGVYRLSRAPLSSGDELYLAWVWSRYKGAISHETALALYGLSDLMPARVQLTVQPNEWRRTDRFSLHRSILQPDEIRHYEGVTVTTAARAVVDAASEGADPEQIQKAVTQGLERGLLAAGELDAALDRRRFRNKRSVSRLIKDAANS